MIRRLTAAGLGALITLGVIGVAGVGAARALPIAPVPTLNVSVISVTNYALPEQYLAQRQLDDFVCEERQALPARSATRLAALAKAEASLKAIASPAALRTFRNSPIYTSKPQLEGAMALSMLNGSVPAALAASLRLARLSQDPRHLINAAVLLLAIRAYPEAADLLAWAKDRPLGLMAGVDGTAAWQSAMGGVLLAYGQFPEAKSAYESALAREPLMATARQGIARSLNCTGEQYLATKWQARSASVVDPLPLMVDDVVEDGEEPRWSATPRPAMLDLAAGKKGPAFLPFMPPQGPDLARGEYSVPVATKWDAYNTRNAMGVQLPFPELTPAQEALDEYLGLSIGDDPVLQDLDKRSTALGEELVAISERSSCPAVDEFAAYWRWIGDNYRVAIQVADRMHLIYTAAAATTGDPALNAYYNAYADYMVDFVYQQFLFGLMAYAAEAENDAFLVHLNDDARERGDPPIDSNCRASFRNGSTGGTYVDDGPRGKGQDASPCSALGSFAKKDILDLALPIPGAPVKPKLKINCEAISLSAKFGSIGGPFAEMGLFGGFSYEWFTNDVVINIGAYAELGPLKLKTGPQIRIGADADGNFGIKDATFIKPGLAIPQIARAGTARGTTYLLVS